MKKRISNLALVAVFFVGLSLLLYPTVSDYWNQRHQTRAIESYSGAVSQMDDAQYEEYLEAARVYNAALIGDVGRWKPEPEETESYEQLLQIEGSEVMGYIEIPAINVYLPLYHGVSERVLQSGIGHMEGSSLPVGGTGSHCALSGHRGLPSARLFTDLDKIAEGDLFMLHVLEEKLTYQVDQILIVEPEDIQALEIDPEKDYCTLVTCTPYGINSHRMLVRGHRIENLVETSPVRISGNDAVQYDPLIVVSVIAAPVLLLVLIWQLVRSRKKKRKK